MRPKVKVCGVTDPVFAAEAARRGIDYIGVIFASSSPRFVGEARAREIAAAVRAERPQSPPKVVGVFVDGTAAEIQRVADAVSLDVVQLHGGQDRETAVELKGEGLEVWRLVEDASSVEALRETVDALLLDGRDGGRSGGTGRLADWARVGELKEMGFRVVLAGGLSSENAVSAVATGADILDFNSSLEISPGVKSIRKLDDLIANLAVAL